MKIIAATAGACALAAVALAAPAFAQDVPSSSPWYVPHSYYGTFGYTGAYGTDGSSADLGAITGRIGANFNRYVGIEGEVSGGVDSDTVNNVRTGLNSQYAGYVVGHLPLTPQAGLFARVGYGGNDFDVKDKALGYTTGYHFNSVNYGGGAQYFFDGVNGVRAEYTRIESQGVHPDADTWSVSYIRKF